MRTTWLGYDPLRVATLHERVRAAIDDLRSWRGDDPAAAAAGTAVRAARQHLEVDWLPVLERILASDAMTAPLSAPLPAVPDDIDSLLAFLRDDALGRIVFGIIDASHQGDLDRADGNWSTDDVEAATGPALVAALLTDADLPAEHRDALVAAVVATATRLQGRDQAWEGIDDEIRWYERGPVGAVWDRLSTYGQHVLLSAQRMAADPVQTLRDVATGTVVVEQAAAAEAILVEDGELYLDGACGTEVPCITGARPLPGATATTFGHTIVFADDDAPPAGAVEHELQHVDDVETFGAAAFYGSYLTHYLWGWGSELDDVARGEPLDDAHQEAYDQVIWERRAED